MKKNVRFFTPSFLNKIGHLCLWAWSFGLFAYNCVAADFDDEKLRCAGDPIKIRNHYPPIAKGHEKIYDRFLKGKLIYNPGQYSDEGKVELRISDLKDPLNGTFDLSRCGQARHYLSISTGYKKRKNPENSPKVEIWICPRFVIEKQLHGTASHFKPIMGNWKQEVPIGMFWTRGDWDDISWYDYLTKESIESLFKSDLYENWQESTHSGVRNQYEHNWLRQKVWSLHLRDEMNFRFYFGVENDSFNRSQPLLLNKFQASEEPSASWITPRTLSIAAAGTAGIAALTYYIMSSGSPHDDECTTSHTINFQQCQERLLQFFLSYNNNEEFSDWSHLREFVDRICNALSTEV